MQQALNAGNITNIKPVYGGDINASFKFIADNGQSFFAKTNEATNAFMFACEFEALTEIAQTSTIKVPKPIIHGTFANQSYIVMEYLELLPLRQISLTNLGHNLAAMHKITQAKFGWHLDNTIGSTKQTNKLAGNWAEFYAEQRLLPQIKMAQANGASSNLIRKAIALMSQLDKILNHNPKPSLLHGDLWGGNCASIAGDVAVIYDPAMYYGDREADIAMSELFGGFGAEFYTAYNAILPLDKGYQQRKIIYNLYHIINHYNLFGGSYDGQACNMLDQII